MLKLGSLIGTCNYNPFVLQYIRFLKSGDDGMLSAYMAMIDDKALCSDFENFYTDNRIKGMRTAFAVLKNNALAEEALSESFMKLAKNYKKIHALPSHKLQAYFVITVRNTALNMLKKESSVETVEYNDELEHLPLPDTDTQNLKECIERLSDTDREILYLRCSLGLEYEQIAQALSISQDAARQRLRHARRKLRNIMEENNE